MAELTTQNLYSELMVFLFFVDDSGDPVARQGLLTAAHVAYLSPRLNFHSPAQVFCGGLVKELADEGQPALVAFLDGLHSNAYVNLGASDTARLQSLRQALAGLSADDWQTYFRGKVTTYLFMPSDLPDDFVPRPLELNQLKDLLLEADPGDGQKKRPKPGIVGLYGFGGYGKTTLALAACHDEEVRQACFPDGILWTELGRDLNETDKKDRMGEWVRKLGGQELPSVTLTAAKENLRQALADRQMLLVIDNVWNEADLEPFLEGGPRCVRLVTTRDTRTLPPKARLLDVGRMVNKDARELLGADLPQGYDAELSELSERLGCWSILLRLAKANLRQRVLRENQPMGAALADILQDLEDKGLAVFDPTNPKESQQAVTATVDFSLVALDEVKRRRYAELGVFPQDVPIPLDVLARLWKKTGGLSRSAVESLCSELYQLSLLLSFDRGSGTIQLHDVLSDYASRTVPERAQVHLALVELWGERPRPSDAYAWRWVAFHLCRAAQASAKPDKHLLAARVVHLVGDPDFQSAHKAAVKDLPALQSALLWGVQAAVADESPEGLPILATAARQMIRFRRTELRPEPLFELAVGGRIEEAERQVELFDLDQDWRHALLLALAWVAAGTNKAKATALRDRVDAEMTRNATLRRLLGWVDVDLRGKAKPVYRPPLDPSVGQPDDRLIRNILNRIGGGEVDGELLNAYGLQAGVSSRGLTPAHGKRTTTAYLVDQDGPFLIAYAVADAQQGAAAFDEYLSVFTNYSYREYRLRSLWILLGHVLHHPEKEWVQKTVRKLFVSALAGGSVEFEDALPIAILALQAGMGDNAMAAYLARRGSELCMQADNMKAGRGGDSWGFHKRHLLALAQAFACLHISGDQINALLTGTETIERSGFAGYQMPANLAFAETARICDPNDTARVGRGLDYSQAAAHRIQETTFSARMTARANAMRKNWYNDFDLATMAKGLHETPQARDFAALYDVKHDYTWRSEHALPLPPWMLNASTLATFARVFDQPIEAFVSLNRERGWGKSTIIGTGAWVYVPDPGFAPHLAARLAAEALAQPNLDPDERIDVIRSLVPSALRSPTVLDAVLARLALAWGMGHPEAITAPLVAALWQEAPLTDSRSVTPPIGELIS